jgi:hypothetical protein
MPFSYESLQKITSAGLVDVTITSTDIAVSAITTDKIADGNITGAKIAAGQVGTSELAAGAVSTAKIADANVSLNSAETTGVLPVIRGGTGLSSVTNDRTLMVNSAGNALEHGFTGIHSCQVWTSNGTWNRPTGVSKIRVQVVGGGGGGTGHGESGGAGGFAEEIIDVSGISSVSITIGGGGGGVNYHNSAGNGGTTSFGPYISAGGGEGARRVGGHSGGRPGAGSGGNFNMYGGGGNGHTHLGGGLGGESFFGGACLAVHQSGVGNVSSYEGRAAPGAGGTGAPRGRRRGGNGKGGMVVVWNLRG